MITPIPIIIHQRESLCPSCSKPERKIDVCGHCGYKYGYAPFTAWDKFVMAISIVGIVIGGIILFFFLIFSIFNWIDGMPLLKAFAKVAKDIWAVLSNLY